MTWKLGGTKVRFVVLAHPRRRTDLLHETAPDAVRDLDEARTLGNWSLHDGLAFSHEEVSDVASVIEKAVFLVYVQPEQRVVVRRSFEATAEPLH
ncbi:hypothetical protein [Streptomyces sp. NPDC002276]